jgi:hypothetical protein
MSYDLARRKPLDPESVLIASTIIVFGWAID